MGISIDESKEKSHSTVGKACFVFAAVTACLVVGVSVAASSRAPAHVGEALKYEKEHLFVDEKVAKQESRNRIVEYEDMFNMELMQESVDSPDELGEEKEYDNRLLAAHSGFHEALSCNKDVSNVECSSISPEAIPSDRQFVIPCGKCFEVATQDGSTLTFPHGIRVDGKFLFPSSANVVVRTKFVFVAGLLKIDPPANDNKVKIQLFGEENVIFTADSSSAKCGYGCSLGSKVIAVVGGTLDVQGNDSTCPVWEKLASIGQGLRRPFAAPCDDKQCLTIEIDGKCHSSQGHADRIGKNTVWCPIKPTAVIPNGETNALRIKSLAPSLEVEDFVPPSDTSGAALDIRIRGKCNKAGHTNWLSKCVVSCPIEPTANIASGDKRPLTFTSVRPVETAFEPPCDAEQCLQLKISGPCKESGGHSSHVGKLVVFCPLESTASIPSGHSGSLRLTSDSGSSILASGVHHWAWKGKTMFFYPNVDTESEVQRAFPVGSLITVSYEDTAAGGETLPVSGIHHWAWGGKTMFFYPDKYSVAECAQAVNDINAMFPTRYGIQVSTRAQTDLPVPVGQEFTAQGVLHWAWKGQYLYFHPDITAAAVSAMYPPGYRMEINFETATDLYDIVVSPEATACWKPGDEILLTSHTRWSADRQIAIIGNSDTSTNTITFQNPIKQPISIKDHANFAVEVALLTRPVVFEAESDSNDAQIGGHLIVHHTSSPQMLEGVEIRNFGQQGRLGRYPVHFHHCGDSESFVKRNVIRGSNQRGYVLHVTNDVLLEDNIALDVVGHCYFLEAGTETGTIFRRNLGAGIVKMPTASVELLGAQSGRKESDDQASVFWISNPDNSFEGNVAAGSNHFGYWFETHGLKNRHGNVRSFTDNEAHSCQSFAFTTYSPGWRPSETTRISGLKVYRNLSWGLFLHVTQNLEFVDGVFADNGSRAVMINRGDSIVFNRSLFLGQTEFAETHRCRPEGKYGIALHPSRLNEFDFTGTVRGTSIVDSEFYNWGAGATSCASGSGPLDFTTSQVFTKTFNAPHTLKDLFFEQVSGDEVDTGVAACSLYDTLGIEDTVLEVVSDESKAFSNTGAPGFLVSPKVAATFPAEVSCTPYNDCLNFCPGVCLRTISVMTDAAAPEGITMVVRGESGEITIERELRDGVIQNPGFWGMFTVVLPPDNYEATFYDRSGGVVWPGFATPVFEAPPACSDQITRESLVFVKPSSARDVCADPVFNGIFLNSIAGWQGQSTGNVYRTGEGSGSSGVLATTTRTSMHGHWVQQWLDTSCIEEGSLYELTVAYKNVDASGNILPACQGKPNDCSVARLGRSSFDPITGRSDEAWKTIGTTNLPYLSTGSDFNMISGLWDVTADDATADRLRLLITEGPGQFILDSVKLRKTSAAEFCSNNNQIYNGDASIGTSKGWHGWGNPVGVISPGANGNGWALRAYDRNRWVRGFHQNLPQLSCLAVGGSWRAKFSTRMYDQTTESSIDNCDEGCPMLRLHTRHEIDSQIVDRFHIIEDNEMVWNAAGKWSSFDVTFPLTDGMMEGDLHFFRFMIVGGPVNSVLLIDDVDFRPVSV